MPQTIPNDPDPVEIFALVNYKRFWESGLAKQMLDGFYGRLPFAPPVLYLDVLNAAGGNFSTGARPTDRWAGASRPKSRACGRSPITCTARAPTWARKATVPSLETMRGECPARATSGCTAAVFPRTTTA